jgi:hypothetical protein
MPFIGMIELFSDLETAIPFYEKTSQFTTLLPIDVETEAQQKYSTISFDSKDMVVTTLDTSHQYQPEYNITNNSTITFIDPISKKTLQLIYNKDIKELELYETETLIQTFQISKN